MVFGYIQDGYDNRDWSFYPISNILRESSIQLPNSISYRNKMTSVKNQGNLGSCVSFACTAVKEYQQYLEHGKEYDFSEQWHYWSCKAIDDYPDSEGTTIRAGMKVLRKWGIPPEHAWEYKDRKQNIGDPESWAYMISKWNLIRAYRRISNVTQMKESLATNGPAIAGVLVFTEFMYPDRNGVISMPDASSTMLGGHAIPITGYDDNKELFEFKNSWGRNWGDNGFGYLPYNYIKHYSIDNWAPIDQDVSIEELAGRIRQVV